MKMCSIKTHIAAAVLIFASLTTAADSPDHAPSLYFFWALLTSSRPSHCCSAVVRHWADKSTGLWAEDGHHLAELAHHVCTTARVNMIVFASKLWIQN
jgi:hypothetical protein